jgi:phosphopantothenoylcysteine decarboxylase/phosphopantothenate--cysteine ligase
MNWNTPPLSGKTIILGISAGIAAYKTCDLTRMLVKAGADVHVVLTKAALNFVTPLTLQTLSRNPVHEEMFSLTEEMEIGHTSLADRADVILIAPATADIIAKVATGICDELLTTVVAASKAPVLFAPSMNKNMWTNPITGRNVSILKEFGYIFIEPEEGELACGYEGKGRLPKLEAIIDNLISIIAGNHETNFKR